MTKPLAILPLLLAIGYASAQDNPKRWTLELETGFTAPRYNYAQVPKETGTNLDLAGLVGKNWRTFGRLSLLYQDPKGGTWKLLVAPFRQSGSGELDAPASFAGKAFAAGAAKATYQSTATASPIANLGRTAGPSAARSKSATPKSGSSRARPTPRNATWAWCPC